MKSLLHEVAGTACRAQRQDYVKAQVWGGSLQKTTSRSLSPWEIRFCVLMKSILNCLASKLNVMSGGKPDTSYQLPNPTLRVKQDSASIMLWVFFLSFQQQWQRWVRVEEKLNTAKNRDILNENQAQSTQNQTPTGQWPQTCKQYNVGVAEG